MATDECLGAQAQGRDRSQLASSSRTVTGAKSFRSQPKTSRTRQIESGCLHQHPPKAERAVI